MKLQRVGRFRAFIMENKVRTVVLVIAAVLGVSIISQLLYRPDKLPPNTTIMGVNVGGKTIGESTKILNKKFNELSLKLYFGQSPEPYREPKLAEVGIAVETKDMVQSVEYDLWQRLVPFSIFWAGTSAEHSEPRYSYDAKKTESYILKEFGKTCRVKSRNANIEYKEKKLGVVPAIDGGKCESKRVKELFATTKPTLEKAEIRVKINAHPAKIADKKAEEFINELQAKTENGLVVLVNDDPLEITQHMLLSWLDFKAPDSGIVAKVSSKKASSFLDKNIAPKLSKPAGTSYVTTLDFTVISQKKGAKGQTFDKTGTIKDINEWLVGAKEDIVAKVAPVQPRVVYTRKYSPTDTGLSALIAQFAQSHPGVYGVSFVELDGKGRRAAYQDTKAFRTASTYKLFVAYSTLRRIDSGAWKWSNSVTGGKNLAKCFDDMIVLSDNACAEALLDKIGFRQITNEIHAIGLKQSSFLGDFIETTAKDLTTFVGALQTKQLPLSDASRNTLLSAMERNVYRKGIPAGAKGAVADKVGFLEDYLNDAAIVYSPTGTYALTILTKGSSWDNIAELTRQIEALRNR